VSPPTRAGAVCADADGMTARSIQAAIDQRVFDIKTFHFRG
jgi:hypothetical protein